MAFIGLPDKIEKQLEAVLTDVQGKLKTLEPAVREAPAVMAYLKTLEAQATGLIAELRVEVAALKEVRERLFPPKPLA